MEVAVQIISIVALIELSKNTTQIVAAFIPKQNILINYVDNLPQSEYFVTPHIKEKFN